MNKPDLPESADVRENPETESVNTGRRRLGKAALATPVIASLAARPALACSVSGFMSGNASPGREDPRCDGYGCTPGFWKNNVKAWKYTPYSPGTCGQWKNGVCKQWTIEGTKLAAILPPSCSTPFDGYKNYYLLELLNLGIKSGGGSTHAQIAHYIAAILNAAASQASYGSSVADVQAGLCKAAADGKVNYYTTTLLAGLNERGCMFNAHGNCESDFVLDDASKTCIPACPTGQIWNSVTMRCETKP